jgi:hypothetical protein
MELSFRQFLENTVKSKLAIFDFDGTLARVPERPQPHEPKHGWKGKDWWGSKESLAPPFYHYEMNDSVMEAFKKAKTDPNTHTILLTGRRGVIADGVRDVLQIHGLHGKRMIPKSNQSDLQKHRGKEHELEDHPHAHEEYFTGDFRTEEDYPRSGKKNKPDGSTMAHKKYVIEKLAGPHVEEIDMWDDRDDHISQWQSLGHRMLKNRPNLRRFTIHRVFNTESGHYVVDIPVT